MEGEKSFRQCWVIKTLFCTDAIIKFHKWYCKKLTNTGKRNLYINIRKWWAHFIYHMKHWVISFISNLGPRLHGKGKILALGRSLKADQLFVWFTCSRFRSGWLPSGEGNWRPLATERPAAAVFVCFLFNDPSTRSFRAKVVYMVLGSS